MASRRWRSYSRQTPRQSMALRCSSWARASRKRKTISRRKSPPWRRFESKQPGPANAMDTDALRCRKRLAQGAKAKAGRAPGETLQRGDRRFRQQPEGNGRPGAPLGVAVLAKTVSLGFVLRLDWCPRAPVRVCAHSVNRPWSVAEGNHRDAENDAVESHHQQRYDAAPNDAHDVCTQGRGE